MAVAVAVAVAVTVPPSYAFLSSIPASLRQLYHPFLTAFFSETAEIHTGNIRIYLISPHWALFHHHTTAQDFFLAAPLHDSNTYFYF